MTTEELNTIVQAVIDKINGQVIDFDVVSSTPESTDLLSAVRSKGDGTYQGVTLKWNDVANAVTREAKGYRDDAVSAKTNVENMKASVEQTVSDFNTLAEEKKTEVQGVYQTDLNELKGDLTVTINNVKQELDDKKITKFYASNNGNMSLPDSDNGKPSDMKIFGKSVQDGTPSPDVPIEIQSVANPVVMMVGKNLLNPSKLRDGDYDRENQGIRVSVDIGDRVYVKKGTKVSLSFTKTTALKRIWLIITDSSNKNLEFLFINSTENATATTTKDGYLTPIFGGTPNSDGTWGLITVNDVIEAKPQLEYGDITEYVPYVATSSYIPYTLNAIPVESGGNVTIDGQQYIADYVDVERRKLVRMVRIKTITVSSDTITYNESSKFFSIYVTEILQTNVLQGLYVSKCNKYKYDLNIWNDLTIENGYVTNMNNLLIRDLRFNDVTSFRNSLQSNPIKLMHRLAIPTETDLTESDITALSSLATYYPVTNVSVVSSQLDGHAIFNYPLNMANGWNYVMQQIGETRPIIYDTQVKTIENLIDTAILTAMMEA